MLISALLTRNSLHKNTQNELIKKLRLKNVKNSSLLSINSHSLPLEVVKMADIKLIYPTPSDFLNNSMIRDPEIYFYTCFRGKQIFLRRFRNSFYQVLTASWKPQSLKKDLSSPFEQGLRYHTIYESKLLENCIMMFKKLMVEMLSQNSDLFDFTSTIDCDEVENV
ncbi:hypothetical protein [Tortoise microvirus 55]|nr:hypothetical protein [Tortoise microvirus 44]QCS37109.1 hypothetical protein [Tortoise microvirus 55]